VQNITGHIDENELARRMWGKYLRDEWKYDKFGAQGKLILLQEVLAEEGVAPRPGLDFQSAVNMVFPRTFYCEHRREIAPTLKRAILKYYGRLEAEFARQGLPEHLIQYICLSETTEKFCLPFSTMSELASSRTAEASAA
jgi:hypothetical protein